MTNPAKKEPLDEQPRATGPQASVGGVIPQQARATLTGEYRELGYKTAGERLDYLRFKMGVVGDILRCDPAGVSEGESVESDLMAAEALHDWFEAVQAGLGPVPVVPSEGGAIPKQGEPVSPSEGG